MQGVGTMQCHGGCACTSPDTCSSHSFGPSVYVACTQFVALAVQFGRLGGCGLGPAPRLAGHRGQLQLVRQTQERYESESTLFAFDFAHFLQLSTTFTASAGGHKLKALRSAGFLAEHSSTRIRPQIPHTLDIFIV